VLVFMTASAPFAAAQVKDAEGFDLKYYGVELCAKCHGKTTPVPASEIFTSRFVEAHIWMGGEGAKGEKQPGDKHQRATLNLRNDRSKQMAKLLGWEGKDLTQEKTCVNCHGVYLDPKRKGFDDIIDQVSYGDPEQRVNSGVSCVACHGPRLKWVKEHAAILGSEWWKKSMSDKVHQWGMYDLVDPVGRAKLCFSCHIGDVAKGRVVTHEMYAAGHPPLPGIEVASFSDAMPAHWEPMSAKIQRARKLQEQKKGKVLNGFDFLRNAYGIDPEREQMEQTRMVAVTCLVAVQASVKLMTDQAKAALAPAPAGNTYASDTRWPMLANYDCYACHHDLSIKSWRQERGYRGRPGRVEARSWSLSLGRFGFDLASGAKDPLALDRAIDPWLEVFQKVPFGTPQAVLERSKSVDAILAAKIAELRKNPFDRAEGKKALRLLSDLAAGDSYDFDSARQFAWALRTVAKEIDPDDTRLTPIFRSLDSELQLKLPEGGQVEIAPKLLDAVYGRISTYQPERFRAKMLEINRLLKASKN
jgi:hypothetical protein